GADQAPADGVPNQLLGIFDRELTQPGRRADRLDDGVRHRAAEHTRDSGKGLEQRRDLRPAELGWHGTRCPDVEGGAKLQSTPPTVKNSGALPSLSLIAQSQRESGLLQVRAPVPFGVNPSRV